MIFALLALLSLPAQAVEVQAGGVYTEGQELSASTFGIQLTVPAGQVAAVQGETLVIGSLMSALSSTVWVQSADEAAIRQELSTPTTQGDVTWTASNVRKEGVHLVADLTGTNAFGAARIGTFEAVFGENGQAAFVLTMGKPKHAGALDGLHRPIVASIRLSKPAGAASTPVSANRPIDPNLRREGAWAAEFSGKVLVYMSTSSTTTETEKLYLCADGSAVYYHSASGSTDNTGGVVASHAGSGVSYGTWGVQGNTLIASGEEGQLQWALSKNAKGNLLLDGYRWFRDSDSGAYCK